MYLTALRGARARRLRTPILVVRCLFRYSLHSGSIQLFDYRIGSLVSTFEEHDGVLRCTSPLPPWTVDWILPAFVICFDHLSFSFIGPVRGIAFHPTLPFFVSGA